MVFNKFHMNTIKNYLENVHEGCMKKKQQQHSLCFVGIKLYKPLFSPVGYD